MYANLRIIRPGEDTVFAHEVTIGPDGILIHLDANDGESSHAEPDETITMPFGESVTITADF
jgi:hypothetical protein